MALKAGYSKRATTYPPPLLRKARGGGGQSAEYKLKSYKMKINVDQIPPQGLTLEETIPPQRLELDAEVVRSCGSIEIKAGVSKITNAVTVDLNLNAPLTFICIRCLNEFEVILKKNLKLNYRVERTQHEIDLNPDIRQDIILDYPINPLCKPDCKGLCPRCGKNLNEGKCSCN